MVITIYCLITPFGVSQAFSNKEDADLEAKNREKIFGEKYSVEEIALTFDNYFKDRIKRIKE